MGNTAIEIDTLQQLKTDLGDEFISELVETYCTETPELIGACRRPSKTRIARLSPGGAFNQVQQCLLAMRLSNRLASWR
jgi:hypothetical protein